MTAFALIILVLFVLNFIWGIQSGFKTGGWPFWVNFLGTLILALIQFTSLM